MGSQQVKWRQCAFDMQKLGPCHQEPVLQAARVRGSAMAECITMRSAEFRLEGVIVRKGESLCRFTKRGSHVRLMPLDFAGVMACGSNVSQLMKLRQSVGVALTKPKEVGHDESVDSVKHLISG